MSAAVAHQASRRDLAVVVALAFALRLVWVVLVPSKPVGDFAMYVEAADHLVATGQLPPNFFYMPGYIVVLAAVRGLGGGLLAARMIGVVAGTLAAASVWGLGWGLWRHRRVALGAGLLAATWPVGITLASVTGTDMPAAALVIAALWAMVGWADTAPRRAAIVGGLLMGAAASVRAVALPLGVVAMLTLHGVVRRDGWRRTTALTAWALAASLLVLAPWAIRNRRTDGVWSVSDAHGGLTALVGANPNVDGRFDRSLQRMWKDVTGIAWLGAPHREADARAYRVAREWLAFEPAYSAGLVAAKLDRLLGSHVGLLYWPIYRAGVLEPSQAAWFATWRGALEGVADGFWLAVVALALLALGRAAATRDRTVLLPLAVAAPLLAVYGLWFGEPRYGLPIVFLLLPLSARGLGCIVGWRSLARARGEARVVVAAVLAVVLGLGAWTLVVRVGHGLVERHRFGASECQVDGVAHFCLWRRTDGQGASPVQGVWDGVVVKSGGARTTLDLAPGSWKVSAVVSSAALTAGGPELTVGGQLATAGAPAATEQAPEAGVVVAVDVEHGGGPLAVEFRSPAGRAWLAGLTAIRR